MTVRSDGHQCEVCGAYGVYGFKQKDGEYHWYCLRHQLKGYTLPDLAPPPELKGQMSMSFDPPDADDHSAMERVRNTFNWGYGLRTWIHWEMKPGAEMIGEKMAAQAARWIGNYSNPNVVGNACKRAFHEGYLTDTGRWEAMSNEDSHGRRSPIWRRTDKR